MTSEELATSMSICHQLAQVSSCIECSRFLLCERAAEARKKLHLTPVTIKLGATGCEVELSPIWNGYHNFQDCVARPRSYSKPYSRNGRCTVRGVA